MNRTIALILAAALALYTAACEEGGESGPEFASDGGGDADGDTDGDADADADADADTDADADADTDADTDADADADGDADADTDADTDTGQTTGCVDEDSDWYCDPIDCNDDDPETYPNAEELPGDNEDNDCDGFTDEDPWQDIDFDNDGFTTNEGDCDEFSEGSELVNPDAVEDLGPNGDGDGVDNDCDGQTDETGCDCTTTTGQSLEAMSCAAEFDCHSNFFGSHAIASPTSDDITSAWTAVNRFGSTTNDLDPRAGNSYALMATGPAEGTSHSSNLPGGIQSSDPYSSDAFPIYDVIEYTVTLTAPSNAQGFSIDYMFFSEEYDDYVGTAYNDKFYVFMNAPITTNGQTRVINFTDCRDATTYYDFTTDCPTPSGYCCYIAINTALSECCWYNGCPDGTWTTDISGTGFECSATQAADGNDNGSSTGWLVTTWNISPGETFTLTFHVHDTQDGIYDSEVILDNFMWSTEPVEPGTSPVT